MVPSVNPVSLYGAVAGLASVPNVMLSVLWSSLYVSPVIVVHVTSISVSEIAVAVTPVGVVGSVQTASILETGLCPIALTAYTLYDISTLGSAALIPECVAVSV